MQSSSKIANYGELDCEEFRIKYSKPKDTLTLFVTEDCYLLTILITQVNTNPFYYSYYLSNNNYTYDKNNKDKLDILSDSIPLLKLASKNNHIYDKNNYIYNAIKNENIFAKIKKKVSF